MRSCNCSRLLLLFSVLLLCHAATVTRQRRRSGSGKDRNQVFQPRSPLLNLKRVLQAMGPSPNCTSLETGSFFDESEQQQQQQQHHNRLECFLWNLKVGIPQQSFEKHWVTITVHDMVCTNFRLHGLRSNSTSNSSVAASLVRSSLSSHEQDLSELRLSVQRVSATCQGRYHSTGGLAGNIVATVEESAPPSPALDLLVGVRGKRRTDISNNQNNNNQNNNIHHSNSSATVKLPSSFETMECGTSLGCQSIQFSGSISAKMIQTFSGMIGRHITQTLQQQVCPLMTKTVDPIITAYLKNFDDLVQQYLEEGVTGAVVDTSDTNDSIAFTRNQQQIDHLNYLETKNIIEYPAMRWVLSFLNEQLRYHLQTGWIPLPAPSFHGGNFRHMSQECIDSFRGISGWVKSMLGPRPRIRLPQYLRQIVFSIPDEFGANGTIVLDIPELVVEGLDQMDALQVLEPLPSGSKDLETKLVSRKGFSVVLPMKLEVRWPKLQGHGFSSKEDIDVSVAPTLQESFRLTINVTQIDASLSSFIQVVDWESTSLLQVVDAVQRFVDSRNLDDLACLFRTLDIVQLSKDGSWVFHNIIVDAIRLSRDKKDVPDGSLEADLDHTINTILELLLADYANLWTHLVKGLVRGPGSRRLNRFVEDWIQKHSNSHGDNHHGDGGGRCPPATPSPRHWVNFTKFEILNTFNRYLDHSHTIKPFNDFMQCLAESVEAAVDGDDDRTYYHIANRNGYGHDRDASSVVVPSVIANEIATNSNLDLLASFSSILKDGMNFFVEPGKTFTIRNDNTATNVNLSRIELRNWDSVRRLQIMKPSGDTTLASSLVFGKKASSEGVEDRDTALSWMASNATDDSVSSSKGPPEITLVVNVGGYNISGQVNVTLFGSLDANAEVNIDYDLNRLENLTITRLFEEINCALLPAMQIRFLPGTTKIAFGKYFGANLTAAIGGRNFSLSTKDHPGFLEISNDALSWSQDFSRTMVNYVVEDWIESSSSKCPGVFVPDDDRSDKKDHGGKPIYWLFRDSTTLWIIFGLIVVMQGGLVFVSRSQSQDGDTHELIQANDSGGVEASSRTTPLLSSYQELMSRPSSETFEQNRVIKQKNSIDDFIIRDICEEWNNEDEPQGILEDQLIEECQEEPKISLFDSDKPPESIKYLVPVMIVGTIVLFLCSNLSVGASVDLSVQLGQQSIGIPGLFQFSLGNTVSEMYLAGIYPLLILVVCFSGIWPYAKLLLMLYSWMRPSPDQHHQERRLLTLDAMGKYSLVDNYVLILFVVAFRFHLGISDNLGIDVYVTPVYGFFSFLFATCLSLVLGHTVLYFHRKSMQHHVEDSGSHAKTSILNHGFKVRNENSHKRLSRIVQGLLLLFVISTMGILIWGFLLESYTFEIGGLAGMMLGEDVRRTSYSVLSLGAALPSSVEDPQSPSIMFLQGTFFFFTVVTPVLCLILIIVLMVMPLTLKSQQYLLVAAEIANSWSAVEVFLLSILAALFQISTFATFMIGDKCDEINILAKSIFGEEDTDAVCFTVDASVESNCWCLLVGVLANFLLVSFCFGFAETALAEKLDDACGGQETSSSSEILPDTKRRHQTFIQKLHGIPFISCILFVPVPGSYPESE